MPEKALRGCTLTRRQDLAPPTSDLRERGEGSHPIQRTSMVPNQIKALPLAAFLNHVTMPIFPSLVLCALPCPLTICPICMHFSSTVICAISSRMWSSHASSCGVFVVAQVSAMLPTHVGFGGRLCGVRGRGSGRKGGEKGESTYGPCHWSFWTSAGLPRQ